MFQEKQNRPHEDDPIVNFITHMHKDYDHLYHIFPHENWWYLMPRDLGKLKSQGWKLHIPATLTSAISLLEMVLPVLIEHRVSWKVLRTFHELKYQSSPPSELPQLGKFITIYPATDEMAVELAALLHEKTRNFSGPVVPSDFRYSEKSQIYYRYGGFAKTYFYDPETSLRTPCILNGDGKKVPDERSASPHYPDWITNPFPVFEKTSKRLATGLFGKGFKVRGILGQSIKGGVYVVSNAERTFILKEARFGTSPDEFGRDMKDRLTNEFNVLKKIAPLHIAPQPLEIFDEEDNRYLLMEHLPGRNLRQYISFRNFLGDDDLHEMRMLCSSLISVVRQCHKEGLVLCDLTPSNVLVTKDGCKLIDLELAHLLSSNERPFIGYTNGYVPLGSETLPRTEFSYDVYALGALLFFIITGTHPYLGAMEDILPRLHEWLNADSFLRDSSFEDIAEIAASLLTSRSTCELEHYASSILSFSTKNVVSTETQQDSLKNTSLFSHSQLTQNAVNIADYLYEQGDWRNAADSLPWLTSRRGHLFHPASFYGGASGLAYYLCEIGQVTSDHKYYLYAAQMMEWVLSHHPLIPGETPLGLYFGYAGVPWLLAVIADGLQDKTYLERAIDIANQLALISPTRLDYTHGAAGIGLMHLELFHRTGDARQLDHAMRLGRVLLEQAEYDPQGNIMWRERGRTIWGFAHGVAGIAYYLLALYSRTRDDTLKAAVDRANSTLERVAVPTAYGQGYSWRKDSVDESVPWTHWCNGASGVGIYLLEAARYLHNTEIENMALKAAHAIRFSHGMTTLCQCHGLAGDGEFLLQVGRAYQHSEMLQAAHRIVNKIYACRLSIDGIPGFVWNNEVMERDPDYMTGYTGIYSFLLRASHANLQRPLLYTGW